MKRTSDSKVYYHNVSTKYMVETKSLNADLLKALIALDVKSHDYIGLKIDTLECVNDVIAVTSLKKTGTFSTWVTNCKREVKLMPEKATPIKRSVVSDNSSFLITSFNVVEGTAVMTQDIGGSIFTINLDAKNNITSYPNAMLKSGSRLLVDPLSVLRSCFEKQDSPRFALLGYTSSALTQIEAKKEIGKLIVNDEKYQLLNGFEDMVANPIEGNMTLQFIVNWLMVDDSDVQAAAAAAAAAAEANAAEANAAEANAAEANAAAD